MTEVNSGIGVESHNGFSIWEHWEGRGDETKSLTWQIEGEMPEEWYSTPGAKNAPILMEFDAERKELYVSMEMCKRFGVQVRIMPENEDGT